MAWAQRMARAGPSKVARIPSPVELDPLPSMALELASADRFVVAEQLPPPAVAYRDGVLGRVHDVGEQHRREHPVAACVAVGSGQEVFDLVELGVSAARPAWMVVAGDLHEAGARDVPGHVAAGRHVDERVVIPVHHQGRDVHRREDPAHVGLLNDLPEPRYRPRAERVPLQARPPRPRYWIILARGDHLCQPGPPLLGEGGHQCVPLVRRRAPREAGRAGNPRAAPRQNECRRAFGVGGSKQDPEQPRVSPRQHDHPFGPHSVHDCAHVVHLFLEGREPARPVR